MLRIARGVVLESEQSLENLLVGMEIGILLRILFRREKQALSW